MMGHWFHGVLFLEVQEALGSLEDLGLLTDGLRHQTGAALLPVVLNDLADSRPFLIILEYAFWLIVAVFLYHLLDITRMVMICMRVLAHVHHHI